jgi:hypothetical protein
MLMKKPTTKRGWLLTGCLGIVVLFLACAGLGALVGPPEQATTVAPAVSEPTTAPAAPATTGAPVATITPTEAPPTIAPTDVPEPTATPVPPTPLPPQEFSGNGQVVQDVQIDVLSTVAFMHNGARNFAVWAYDAGDDRELLVNTIGAYQGMRWLPPGVYSMEIDADGAWTMVVAPMALDQAAGGAMQGAGDYVSGVFEAEGGRAAYTFSHDGSRNFAVWLYCENGRDLLMNDVGAVQAEAMVRASGRCFWDVQADGAWSIAPK